MTKKCRFDMLHHHQSLSKNGGGAIPQGTTDTHHIIKNYVGGAPVESRANGAVFVTHMDPESNGILYAMVERIKCGIPLNMPIRENGRIVPLEELERRGMVPVPQNNGDSTPEEGTMKDV